MKNILACSSEHEFHTPDSVLITGDCGHRIWVSPEGMQAIKEHDLDARCMACLPTDGEVSTLPSMMKRAVEELGEEEVERVLNMYKDPHYRAMAGIFASLSRAQSDHPRWQ